jgi:hypothetical protein
MKAIVKYSVLFLIIAAANSSFAGNTEDKYSFKFTESKVISGNTDTGLFPGSNN